MSEPTVSELIVKLDRSAFVWDNKLNELWPETRAVIEAADKHAEYCRSHFVGLCLTCDALAAWRKRAQEVLA